MHAIGVVSHRDLQRVEQLIVAKSGSGRSLFKNAKWNSRFIWTLTLNQWEIDDIEAHAHPYVFVTMPAIGAVSHRDLCIVEQLLVVKSRVMMPLWNSKFKWTLTLN